MLEKPRQLTDEEILKYLGTQDQVFVTLFEALPPEAKDSLLHAVKEKVKNGNLSLLEISRYFRKLLIENQKMQNIPAENSDLKHRPKTPTENIRERGLTYRWAEQTAGQKISEAEKIIEKEIKKESLSARKYVN